MNREQREQKRQYKERWQQVSASIEDALSEVAEMMRLTFAAIGNPDPDSNLDQVGLKDGDEIVIEYLQHHEFGLALEHLCYMIDAADLHISPYAYNAIVSAGTTMQMSSTLWIKFYPAISLGN